MDGAPVCTGGLIPTAVGVWGKANELLSTTAMSYGLIPTGVGERHGAFTHRTGQGVDPHGCGGKGCSRPLDLLRRWVDPHGCGGKLFIVFLHLLGFRVDPHGCGGKP